MSNCIFFHDSTEVVRFSPFDMSVMRMRSLLNDCPRNLPDWEKDPINYNVWYYLKYNTTVNADGVFIAFGRGRSSHTWRDFRWLVNGILKPIMLRDKEHTFVMTDEGYPGKFRCKVVFGQEMK